MEKTYYIDTMGCQMNERDSETIAGILEDLGYIEGDRIGSADVIVLNTCAVRAKPVHKVFSKLGEIRQIKESKPDTTVVVAGCVAQVAHEQLAERTPFVDVVVGPRNLCQLREALGEVQDGQRVLVDGSQVIPEHLPCARVNGVNAYVNITYGCDNFCAYCIVPYARGREESRSPQDVVEEARGAVEDRYPQVTLLGQNVNSYNWEVEGGRDIDFAELLGMMAEIDGLRRLRFTTSHPKDLSEAVLDAIRDLDCVCEHLHLAIQAGDDDVLERMGRGYSYAHFKSLVDEARARIARIAITTDVMVGFPGETEQQFEQTLRAFEEIEFDQAFMFMYDDRPGTRAADMRDKVSEQVKHERLERLIELQNEISRRKNEALRGNVYRVLVEGFDEKSQGMLRGRTRTNKLMIFDPSAIRHGPLPGVGDIVPVLAEQGFLWGFKGRLVLQPVV